MFGEVNYGGPVIGGVERFLYCPKCNTVTRFFEWQGQRYFFIFFIPIAKKGPKFNCLMCERCETKYSMNFADESMRNDNFEKARAEFKQQLADEEAKEANRIKCPRCQSGLGKINFEEAEKFFACPQCGNEVLIKKNYK